MDIRKHDGTIIAPGGAPRSLKLLIIDVYKRPGQSSMDIMGEVKQLTDSDLADFRRWFTDAGITVQ